MRSEGAARPDICIVNRQIVCQTVIEQNSRVLVAEKRAANMFEDFSADNTLLITRSCSSPIYPKLNSEHELVRTAECASKGSDNAIGSHEAKMNLGHVMSIITNLVTKQFTNHDAIPKLRQHWQTPNNIQGNLTNRWSYSPTTRAIRAPLPETILLQSVLSPTEPFYCKVIHTLFFIKTNSSREDSTVKRFPRRLCSKMVP